MRDRTSFNFKTTFSENPCMKWFSFFTNDSQIPQPRTSRLDLTLKLLLDFLDGLKRGFPLLHMLCDSAVRKKERKEEQNQSHTNQKSYQDEPTETNTVVGSNEKKEKKNRTNHTQTKKAIRMNRQKLTL